MFAQVEQINQMQQPRKQSEMMNQIIYPNDFAYSDNFQPTRQTAKFNGDAVD